MENNLLRHLVVVFYKGDLTLTIFFYFFLIFFLYICYTDKYFGDKEFFLFNKQL